MDGSVVENEKSWDEFAVVANFSNCWWCGRRGGQRPAGWNGPWMIERAHIVSKPRRKDRRVAGLLCSRCHKVEHGERIFIPGEVVLQPTVAEMLWLKKANDPEYFDLHYMQRNVVGLLPKLKEPKQRVWLIPGAWSLWFKKNGSLLFHWRKEVLDSIERVND